MGARNFAVLLAATLCWNQAPAFETGKDLVKGMEAYRKYQENEGLNLEEVFFQPLFIGYVLGIRDAGDRNAFCLLPHVTNQDVLAVVANYAEMHPEKWELASHHVVIKALSTAFPCQRTQQLRTVEAPGKSGG